jgi:hypothetical protein
VSLQFPEKLYSWVLKASLKNGLSLPEKVFSYDEKKKFRDLIDIDWVSSKCFKNFENLGLGDEAENKILSWIMNNSIETPDKDEISLLIKAAKSINGLQIKNFSELKKWSFIIYFYHERLKKIALKKWLSFVDNFAKTKTDETLPDLFDFLGDYLEHEWIVLDSFGLPLVDYFLQKSSVLFPLFKVHKINYSQISSTTTTSSFWNEIVSHKWKKKFYKLDVFDKLLHEKTVFEEIVNVGFAEFEVACKNLNKKLDPVKPILIFSDHGFRLSSSGKKFIHGGNSTLERTVPLIELKVVD